MRISDWRSDVCPSDLIGTTAARAQKPAASRRENAMTDITRRDILIGGATLAAGTALLRPFPLRAEIVAADVPMPKLDVEKGASLRVLRPSKFVQGDETLFNENTKKYTEKIGRAHV